MPNGLKLFALEEAFRTLSSCSISM